MSTTANSQRSFLSSQIMGISISESPDLAQLGLGYVHLQDAMVEFARYLLASGASLAYGGDLRQGGFTEVLFELVQTHNQSGLPPYERIINFLAWPIHLKLNLEQKAALKKIARFRPTAPPADLDVDPTTFVAPDSVENQYIWARCLTAMREEMSRSTDARLLLGGRLTGYKGKYPGLVEEAFIAMRNEKPLFLIGGFGGCPKVIIDALRGGHPEPLHTDVQIKANPGYGELITYYNSHIERLPDHSQEAIDYDQLVEFFNKKGVEGVHNGLSVEENEQLFSTPHIPMMISLVLKGLATLAKKRKHESTTI